MVANARFLHDIRGMSGFALQLRGELLRLLARKRTLLGFGAYAFVAILLPILLGIAAAERPIRQFIEQHGYSADYFSALTLALITMRTTMLLLGSIYVALVAGDIVAKEIEDGSMRMLLSRPVTRTRILAQKAISVSIYTFALTLFVGFIALASGFVHEGAGGLLALGPPEGIVAFHSFASGLTRYFIALPLVALTLHSVAAMGFMFSCFHMKPAAASIATLSFFFLDFTLRSVPFFQPFEPYLITPRLSIWMQVFQPDIPWALIVETYALLLAFDATLVIAGWLAFEERDLMA